MTFEEIVYKRLSECKALTECLARHNGSPGIFYQYAPADDQAGWEQQKQYPRIVYNIDMHADKERKTDGTMMLSVFCNHTGAPPEIIEPLVKQCLESLIITPDGKAPRGIAWSRSDGFEIPDTDTRIIGTEIVYDINEYTSQETSDPDPVVALNRYIKDNVKGSEVIGMDRLGHYKIADGPIYYCRLDMAEKGLETNTVAWMDGRIAVHVLCKDADTRLKWIMSLANRLSVDGDVIMLDGSPMKVKRLVVSPGADYLKEGQLMVTVGYGLLRYKAKPHVVTGIGTNYTH